MLPLASLRASLKAVRTSSKLFNSSRPPLCRIERLTMAFGWLIGTPSSKVLAVVSSQPGPEWVYEKLVGPIWNTGGDVVVDAAVPALVMGNTERRRQIHPQSHSASNCAICRPSRSLVEVILNSLIRKISERQVGLTIARRAYQLFPI